MEKPKYPLEGMITELYIRKTIFFIGLFVMYQYAYIT